MLIGYARVSTQDQTLNLQKDALQKAGCGTMFTDTISGAKAERPGLDQALAYVRPGDTLVVWRLDRLGRSLKHLIETITMLHDRQIGFKSITENIDTTTSGGKLIFHIFGALAEFERDIIKERTMHPTALTISATPSKSPDQHCTGISRQEADQPKKHANEIFTDLPSAGYKRYTSWNGRIPPEQTMPVPERAVPTGRPRHPSLAAQQSRSALR
jgi:hypothetical protein